MIRAFCSKCGFEKNLGDGRRFKGKKLVCPKCRRPLDLIPSEGEDSEETGKDGSDRRERRSGKERGKKLSQEESRQIRDLQKAYLRSRGRERGGGRREGGTGLGGKTLFFLIVTGILLFALGLALGITIGYRLARRKTVPVEGGQRDGRDLKDSIRVVRGGMSTGRETKYG